MAAAFILAAASPTFTADLDRPTLANLHDAMEPRGFTVGWRTSYGGPDYFRLEGVTVRTSRPNFPPMLPLGDVLLDDVSVENGRFEIGLVSLPLIRVRDTTGLLFVSGVTIKGFGFSKQPDASWPTFRHFGLTGVGYISGKTPIFDLRNLYIDKEPLPDGGLAVGAGADISLGDLSNFRFEQESQSFLERLGYKTFKASFNGSAEWKPDNLLKIYDLHAKISEMADLTVKAEIGGLSATAIDVIGQIFRHGSAIANDPATEKLRARFLDAFKDVTLNSATITMKDLSLTNRFLDYRAQQLGGTREDAALAATDFLGSAFLRIGDRQAAMNVMSGFSKFWDAPKTVKIALEPSTGVPFLSLLQLYAGKSHQIPALGLTVDLNDTP